MLRNEKKRPEISEDRKDSPEEEAISSRCIHICATCIALNSERERRALAENVASTFFYPITDANLYPIFFPFPYFFMSCCFVTYVPVSTLHVTHACIHSILPTYDVAYEPDDEEKQTESANRKGEAHELVFLSRSVGPTTTI